MTSSPEHRNQKKYPQLWKIVAGAVKSAMDAHEDFVISTPASIVKRVVGQLLTHGVGTELPSVDMDCPDMGISEQGGGTPRYPPPFPLQIFATHQEWVNRAKYVLTAHPMYHNTEHNKHGWDGHHFTALCFDSQGKRCRSGADMATAEYPVWWIWPDQIVELL